MIVREVGHATTLASEAPDLSFFSLSFVARIPQYHHCQFSLSSSTASSASSPALAVLGIALGDAKPCHSFGGRRLQIPISLQLTDSDLCDADHRSFVQPRLCSFYSSCSLFAVFSSTATFALIFSCRRLRDLFSSQLLSSCSGI